MEYPRLVFYSLAIGAGLIGAVADCCINKWAKSGGTAWWVVVGIMFWNVALTLFIYLLKQGHHLSHCAALFAAANGALILLACWLVFRENLSALSWAGVGLIFIGVVVLELGR